MFRKKLFYLSLILIFLSACSGIDSRLRGKIEDSLAGRIRELYSILSVIRVNNAGARDYIKQFFLNDADLDTFVVLTTQRLIRARVYDMKIRGVKIEDVSINGNVATVKIKYWGNKRFPLFKGKVEEVQKWVHVNGTWYLKPLPFLE